MKHCEIKGIIPPILTPMNNDEEQTVNHAELRNQVERLLAGGVHGHLCQSCCRRPAENHRQEFHHRERGRRQRHGWL